MTLHTATSASLEAFLKGTGPRFIASLLLSGLAEVHSNASLFGGVDSTSFKIKWKQIDRRGRQACAFLRGA